MRREGVAETELLVEEYSRCKMLLVTVVTMKVAIVDSSTKAYVEKEIFSEEKK